MAAVVLLGATSAEAGSPRSAKITANVAHRHLTATWTLPQGVEPQVIEIATAPNTGADGSFLEDNREELDLLENGQTLYLDTQELGLGTYWVHIQTLDTDCSATENSTCLAWSNIVSVTIKIDANNRPALRLVRLDAHRREAEVTACDDTDGRLTFRTTLYVDRFGSGHATRRGTYSPFTRPTYSEGERNCAPFYVPLPALFLPGRYTLTMTATDARGGKSKPVVRKWTTSD